MYIRSGIHEKICLDSFFFDHFTLFFWAILLQIITLHSTAQVANDNKADSDKIHSRVSLVNCSRDD